MLDVSAGSQMCSYRWYVMQVLGTKSRSFGRTENILNHWAITPTPKRGFWIKGVINSAMKSAYLDWNIALKLHMVSNNIYCYVPVDSYTDKVKIMFMSFQIYMICVCYLEFIIENILLKLHYSFRVVFPSVSF